MEKILFPIVLKYRSLIATKKIEKVINDVIGAVKKKFADKDDPEYDPSYENIYHGTQFV